MRSHHEDDSPLLPGKSEEQEDHDGTPKNIYPFPGRDSLPSKSDAPVPQPSLGQYLEEPADPDAPPQIEYAMADTPSREEINARIEAAEARTEARFAQLTGTIDVRFANLDNKLDRLVDSVGLLSTQMIDVGKEVRAENKTTRTAIVGIAIGATIAALAALWMAQANMLASFQAALAVKAIQSEPPKH